MGEFLLRQWHLFVLSIKRYCFFSVQLFRFSYLSRYLFLVLFSFYFLVLVLCSPIVPMGVSIPRVDISQDTRIKIHLAFASELLPELILFVIMHTHTHTSPLSLSPSLWSDPINHPSDTVYLSFTSFPLWLMEEHSFRFSTTQISFSLFYFYFFFQGENRMASFNLPSDFFFFCSAQWRPVRFLDKSVCVCPTFDLSPEFFFSAIPSFFWLTEVIYSDNESGHPRWKMFTFFIDVCWCERRPIPYFLVWIEFVCFRDILSFLSISLWPDESGRRKKRAGRRCDSRRDVNLIDWNGIAGQLHDITPTDWWSDWKEEHGK